MPFKKGQSGNPAGKKKGTKHSSELREFLSGVLAENQKKFKTTLASLNKAEFIKLYLETLQYTLPKLKQVEINDTPEIERFIRMSLAEKQELYKKVKTDLRNEKR